MARRGSLGTDGSAQLLSAAAGLGGVGHPFRQDSMGNMAHSASLAMGQQHQQAPPPPHNDTNTLVSRAMSHALRQDASSAISLGSLAALAARPDALPSSFSGPNGGGANNTSVRLLFYFFNS